MAPEKFEVAWNAEIDALIEGWSPDALSVDWDKVRGDILEFHRLKYTHYSTSETTFEHVHQQVLDQLSSRLSPAIWGHFPGEIVDYFLDSVLPSVEMNPSPKLKRILSRLSVVCKRWSYHCRPFLFHRLILDGTGDPSVLYDILHSPTSSWLRDHIETVTFKQVGSLSNPESSQSLCVSALPRLCRILYAYQSKTGGRGPVIPIALRTIWSHNTIPLIRLQLETYRFHSAATLIRMLGALPQLEEVQLYRVSWNVATTDAAPQCKAEFRSLKRVCATECQERWPLAWMFAAATMRHKFRFARRVEERNVPQDVAVVVQICKMFDKGGQQYRTVMLERQEPTADEDEHITTFRLSHGDSNTICHYSYELAFVSLPSFSGMESSSPARDLRRLLISVSPDVAFSSLTALSWKTLESYLYSTRTSLTVLLGPSTTADEAEYLNAELPSRMARTALRVKHKAEENEQVDRETQLDMDIFSWVKWPSDVSDVFMFDPAARNFEAAKYVRL